MMSDKAMKIIREKFVEDIFDGIFKGKQAKCARAIGIPASYVDKIRKGETPGGAVLFGRLAFFCQQNQLNPGDYILNYVAVVPADNKEGA